MLSCIDLSVDLQHKNIFNGLSFTLLPGAIYVLKGANGSGKTTLLKTIAGLVKPTKGEILWNNKVIDKDYVAYLAHENAVKSELSILDNLSLWAELKDSHQLIMPALAQFKLLELMNIKCKYLSQGMQKRVALARMIIANSKLWLLDEPEANLDIEGCELLLKLLQIKINNGGMAIIASHNLEYYSKMPIINLKDFQNEK